MTYSTSYSYSALNTYRKCPRQFEQQYKLRNFKSSGGDAANTGKIIHEQIEHFIEGKRDALPATLPPDGLVQNLRAGFQQGLDIKVELKLAVDDNLEPCAFFARKTHVLLRGALDVQINTGASVTAIDWKGLAVDTPLPTPEGWTTMGDVQVGDAVIGGNGVSCTVLGKSRVKHIPGFRIDFDDKSTVTCDEEHLWSLVGGEVKPVTDLRVGDHVPVAGVFDPGADTALPLDPYVLGLWLADGKHTSGEITKPDSFVFDEVERRGYVVGADISGGGTPTRTIYGIRGALSDLGVLGNKHIPAMYLRAGVHQRHDLLQGLMDGDGNANPHRKQVVFTTVDRRLSDQVFELVSSLGQRVNQSVTTQRGFGKEVTAYPLAWRPLRGINPFRLPRKSSRVDPEWGPGRSATRRVVAITPLAEVESQCIAVDSIDNTYLCTRAFIPTHNTGKRWPRDQAFQADVYHMLLRAHYPEAETRVIFDFLTNGRDAPDVADGQETREILSLIDEVEAQTVFNPQPSPLCRFCPVITCEYNEVGG